MSNYAMMNCTMSNSTWDCTVSNSTGGNTTTTTTSSGNTVSSSDVLAITALVISVAAFFTTALQVLQQYLATAAGYRRCAPSVIGLWSKGTHRKFRRRELRFEVVFETPVIFLAKPDNKRGPIFGRDIHNIDGSDESYRISNTIKLEKERLTKISTADDEQASWLVLLGAIQREEAESREWERANWQTPRGFTYAKPEYTICHSMQKKTRSWDFMPPAVTKPYATTTISHLVEMIGMLGMSWKAFDEIRGNLRAEGNGYMLTSTLLQGLGLVTNFSTTGTSKFEDTRVIPCHDIKELVFGFVPCILGHNTLLEFGLPEERVKRTLLSTLKCGLDVFEEYQAKKDRPDMFPVTFELMAMLAIPLRIRGSNLRMLPNPTLDKWPGPSLTIEFSEEMVEFQKHFGDAAKSVVAVGDPQPQHGLLIAIADQWTKMKVVWSNKIDIDMREKIHDALDQVDEALANRQEYSLGEIQSVMASHLMAVLAANDLLQSGINANPKAKSKFAQFYIDHILPEVRDDPNRPASPEETKSKRGVIWLALVFRMICWFLLHDFNKSDVNMMTADMKGSRMPVFIG